MASSIATTTLACVGLALTAASASADCPDKKDLTRGIRLDFADGVYLIYRATGAGRIEVTQIDGGTLVGVQAYARGIYPLGDAEAGDGISFAYPVPVAGMPIPAPGAAWSVTVARSAPDGTAPLGLDIRFGAAGSEAVGDCTLRMIPVEMRYEGGTFDGVTDTIHYFPDLGMSFTAGSSYAGAPQEYVLPFAITAER